MAQVNKTHSQNKLHNQGIYSLHHQISADEEGQIEEEDERVVRISNGRNDKNKRTNIYGEGSQEKSKTLGGSAVPTHKGNGGMQVSPYSVSVKAFPKFAKTNENPKKKGGIAVNVI